MIGSKKNAKYFFFLIFLSLFVWLLSPFFVSAVFALIFAIIFYPFFKILRDKWRINENISAALVVVFTFFLIIGPIMTLVGLVGSEAFNLAKNFDKKEALELFESRDVYELFGYEIDLADLKVQSIEIAKNAGNKIYELSADIGAAVSNFLFLFFVYLFIYFYFLRDGEKIFNRIKSILPYTKRQNSLIISRIKEIVKVIFVGNVSVSLISGLISYIGFLIFDVKSALIFALLTGILSLIPSVGSFIVYLFVAVMLGFSSDYKVAIALMIYFLIFDLILKENIIKPKLIDDKITAHPILVFFGLVGGATQFGSMGIIYGPIIVVLFLTTFDLMAKGRK